MAYYSGLDGKVKIGPEGGTTLALHASSWDGTFESDDHDVSNFESGGWQAIIGGLKRANGTISAKACTEDEVHGAELGIIPGALVELELQLAPGRIYGGLAFVKSFQPKVQVNGDIEYSIAWKSAGVWVMPTSTSGP